MLLGPRTCVKEDISTSASELVYGTTLRIPGEFIMDSEVSDPQQIHSERLRRHMRQLRPVPTAQHSKRRPFAHKDLYSCTRVLFKVGGTKRTLEQPFEGPSKVLERIADNVFIIEKDGEPMTVSTERLKPAYMESVPQEAF